jgi:hypothetical protein
VNSAYETISRSQGSLLLERVCSHSHIDISTGHARIYHFDLDLFGDWREDLCVDDGYVGVIAEAWDKGFADCGRHVVLIGCVTENDGVMN